MPDSKMTKLQIPSRDEVVAACNTDRSCNQGIKYNDQIWIKYGSTVRLAEASFQRYVHEKADPSIVRIPKVYDAFRHSFPDNRSFTYIVLENVEDDDYDAFAKEHPEEAPKYLGAIAAAVRHIWDLPLPPDALVGPFEREIPVDRFFSDCGSDRSFNNLVELEDWVNNKLEEAGRPHRVSLQGEQLYLCHCDLAGHNIKVGERITILDWGFSGIYSFEESAIVTQFNLGGRKFARLLHGELFGEKPSKDYNPLALAARYHFCGR